MSWSVRGLKDARVEFVMVAREADTNKSAACRQFGISRKTGYKWLHRYNTSGLDGLINQSRRPRSATTFGFGPTHPSCQSGYRRQAGDLAVRARVTPNESCP